MPFLNINFFSATVPGPVEGLSITTSSYSLNVMWQPPLYPNGVLTGYQVTVTNLINTMEAFSHTVDPNSQELIIDSEIRKLIIILHVCFNHISVKNLSIKHTAKVMEYVRVPPPM